MKAKVYLEPEWLKSYEGRCFGRQIHLAPGFDPYDWYVRFQLEDGEFRTFSRSLTMKFVCESLHDANYDLRFAVWYETESKRHGYNPFLNPSNIPSWEQINPNVYFARNPDTQLVKIGYSDDFDGRLYQLRRQYKAKLELLGVMEGGLGVEREVQGIFAKQRVEREWFTDAPELRDFIESYCYFPPFPLRD